jgi:hypothetical protein
VSDAGTERDQLDRPGLDPGRPVAGVADGAARQRLEDPGRPDPGHVDTPLPTRPEFYRQLYRAERVARESAQKAADDVIAQIGEGCIWVGLFLVLKLGLEKALR